MQCLQRTSQRLRGHVGELASQTGAAARRVAKAQDTGLGSPQVMDGLRRAWPRVVNPDFVGSKPLGIKSRP